jgi:hypothetical protein
MTEPPDAEPTTTQLRDYYEALLALKEEEQTVLAEAHAEDPTLLIHRFAESVKKAELRVGQGVESLHDREPLAAAESLGEIKSTIDFARHLVDRECVVAAPHSELGFAYVDREIFPGRTTGPARMRKRTADLLLVNARDRLPIVGELKIASDRPTYFAFVQALMHAVELVSGTQRARLEREYEDIGFAWAADGPSIDLYLIAYEPPQTGEFRERSTAATERIAKTMIASPKVSKWLRRIAYLEAKSAGGQLSFEALFVAGLPLDENRGTLIGVAPKRLADAPLRHLPQAVAGEAYEAVANVALDWQQTSSQARFWEMGTAGVDASNEGRVYAFAGQMASAGEQLALALAAAVEVAIWRDARVGEPEPDPVEEMQMRGMAEAQSLFVMGTGHALANLAVRVLALDESCRAELGRKLGRGKTLTFAPFSTDRADWISLNRTACKAIRAAARSTGHRAVIDLVEPIAEFGTGTSWRDLEERRGQDFHRWRPQTPGLGGGPRQSPWVHDGETRRLDFHGTVDDEVEALAEKVAELATAAMMDVSAAMTEFGQRWPAASGQLGGPKFVSS